MIHQGCPYLWDEGYPLPTPVIALEGGSDGLVKVLRYSTRCPWYGSTDVASTEDLTPQPCRYYHGELPI